MQLLQLQAGENWAAQAEHSHLPFIFIINMIIEDYYGFPQGKHDFTELPRERSSNRTEKSTKNRDITRRSPLIRTLKRTELSNQKLHSRDSKKSKKNPPLQSFKQQSSRQQPSAIVNEQAADSNRQSLAMMARKYENYKNTDSYEFRDIQPPNPYPSNGIQSSNQENYNQRGYRFEKETPTRRNRLETEQQDQYYDKNYRSASRGKRDEFLVHFQKEGAATNPIEKYVQNRSSSNDIRVKKSRSLGGKLKPYKMHTFYNAEKRNYYNYNEEGYMTERQHELLNRIEEKALRAFQKAAAESSNRKPQPEQKKRPARQFQIEESSRVKHERSGILQGLKKDSAYDDTPLSSRQQLSKEMVSNKKQQRVVELSINPKRPSSSNYDDYQMSISSKKEMNENVQIESSKNVPKEVKKDIFQKFAKEDSSDDISLLQFKPVKPKEAQKNLQREDSVKRSSEISNDYKSIDMMEINSNYKPSNKQIKERNDFIVDDNRSLGIDTIRNHQVNKKNKEQQESQRESNIQLSNSNISASSSDSSDNLSKSSLKKSSKKSSESKRDSDPKIDFSKNKVKKSYSMSEVHSQSSLHDNVKKPQGKDIVGNFKKATNPLTESERLQSSNGSLEMSNSLSNSQPKIKIKRLVKQSNKSISEKQQEQAQANIGVLGVQSFSNYDQLSPSIPIKVNPIQKSKISERSPRSEMEHSSKEGSPSKFKEKPSNSSFRQKSQASIAYRSRVKQSQHMSSNMEYDLFGEIRDFLQMQQFQYNQTRRAKEVRELIPDELDEVLGRIQDHLYIVNCMAQIILLVPDVYDFQTIYDKTKGWIFYQVFLTLKKYLYERGRVIISLSGGKNCFNLLNYQIEDNTLKKYLSRVEITNIRNDLEQCNLKLDGIMTHFYNFLINFNKEGFGREPAINLKPMRMNEDLVLILSQYIKEVQTLKKKKEQQFKGGDVSPQDEDQYQMVIVINQRIFRLMEMSFIMSNLAGREIKPCEKDEEVFQDEDRFKTYLFQNYDLFKETIRYFK